MTLAEAREDQLRQQRELVSFLRRGRRPWVTADMLLCNGECRKLVPDPNCPLHGPNGPG